MFSAVLRSRRSPSVPQGRQNVADRLQRLLHSASSPDLSIVIPVNAQGDLEKVWNLLDDISQYGGTSRLEIVLLVNNFEPTTPPREVEDYSAAGITVASVANARRRGEAIGFTARILGTQSAHCDRIVSFDSDCRIPNATALLDWYADQLGKGADLAYTHVSFYEVRRSGAVWMQIAVHHASRWVKRHVLGIPTARGSNYGFRRSVVQELYSQGMLADEINVGPVIRSKRGRIAYSSSRNLRVMTSARMFEGGWIKLFRYLRYRLLYNMRVIKVRTDAAHHTGRERDPVRKFVDNRPVK